MIPWDLWLLLNNLLGTNELIRTQKQGFQTQMTKKPINTNETVQFEILSTKGSNEPNLDPAASAKPAISAILCQKLLLALSHSPLAHEIAVGKECHNEE